jgi:hypothetical protein
MADRAVAEGFLRDVHRELLLTDSDPARLLDRIANYVMPAVDKWMDPVNR